MLKWPHIQYVILRNIPFFVEATPTVPVCFWYSRVMASVSRTLDGLSSLTRSQPHQIAVNGVTFPTSQNLSTQRMITWRRFKMDVRIIHWYKYQNILSMCEQIFIDLKWKWFKWIWLTNCLFYFRCWLCWCFGSLCQIQVNS